MSENTTTIKRSSTRRTRRKPKKNQIPFGILVLLVVIAIAVFLGTRNKSVMILFILGTTFGVILQKGRFCFTASMRDPYLTGSTSLTRAVLIAFMIATLGFSAIKYGYQAKGLPMPGMGYVVPVSVATIVGAFMFGIGMVIAGGCASGTLMRVGEGFLMQILSLFFFVVGSLWGAHDFGWWSEKFISKGKAIFLPDVFGWVGALVLQLGLMVILYIAAEKYEVKRTK